MFNYFIIYFFAELFISLKVGISIGFFWSVVWILGSMFLGFFLLKHSNYTLFYGMQKLHSGEFDMHLLSNSAISYLFGAILLIIPGVLSDLIGLFLLVYILYLHLFVKIPTRKSQNKSQYYKGDLDVIDTEIIDSSSSSNKLDKC